MTTNTDINTTEDSTRQGPPECVPLPGDEPAMREWANDLVERSRRDGVELTGEGGLSTELVRQVMQTSLEAEMTGHVGYEPHAVEGRGSGNSRNGSYPKTVTTEVGKRPDRSRSRRNDTGTPTGPATTSRGTAQPTRTSTRAVPLDQDAGPSFAEDHLGER